MGLLKGSVTFSRYRIVGALPDHFPEFFNERIRRYVFQTVWRTTDEKAAGWTSLENCLDTDFPYASYAQGRYMLFSPRIGDLHWSDFSRAKGLIQEGEAAARLALGDIREAIPIYKKMLRMIRKFTPRKR